MTPKEEYRTLLLRLAELQAPFAAGEEGDAAWSAECDALRERMDPLWSAMDAADREVMRLVSAYLNGYYDGKHGRDACQQPT